jgi:SsrA-binding protein
MHKREIARLYGKVKQEGYALIPLNLYFKGPWVKIEIGLCKGKKLHDKRDSQMQKDTRREMDRTVKEYNR